MKSDRLSEITPELQAARDDEVLAEGSIREALGAGQWSAAHRAVDQLHEAREKRAALEAELEELLIAALTA